MKGFCTHTRCSGFLVFSLWVGYLKGIIAECAGGTVEIPNSCKIGPYKWQNIWGNNSTTLKLDVNSEIPPDFAKTNRTLPAHTPAECCAACWAREDCNGWVFCADVNGCGYCDKEDVSWNPSDPVHTGRLGPYGKCTVQGTFAFRTCTLKQVHGPPGNSLTKSDDEGWLADIFIR
eukprot:jgi/Botrbrau1/12475/Bobra.0169s0022.1